ncbi:hypothetical protein Dimus_007324 [Dionaea muscipula]
MSLVADDAGGKPSTQVADVGRRASRPTVHRRLAPNPNPCVSRSMKKKIDPFRPLWDINPVPRLIYSLDWLPDPRCVITSYDDGTLRILSLGKAAYDVPATGKPYAGTHQQGLHSLYCSPFAIWSVHVSRLTGMVAYCGADGNALHFQLTVKAVEKDPHRHRAPHFLCGSFTDEGSAVIVSTPPSDDPYPMKSSANEWSNAPRSIRGYVYKSNRARRMKNEVSIMHKPDSEVLGKISGYVDVDKSNQARRKKNEVSTMHKPDSEVLALCYGDEPGATEEIGEPVTRSSKTCKPTSSSRKKPTTDNHQDGDPESTTGSKEKTGGDEIEILPSKMVAMHRVRWNMNKGSERWLCYGGAAGILRCQEIFLPDVNKEKSRKHKHNAHLT